MALHVTLICGSYKLLIPANPYPMYPYAEQLNCISVDSATGIRHVFNHGPTRINASIVWKAIHYDVVKEYENFLLNHVRLGEVSFKIKCPSYMDLGKGMGESIENAQYAGPSKLKSIISLRGDAGLYYDIELPYMFVRGS
ncbi:MAG: hypothetical protein LBU89_01025 [Fibromonadaceae bacterium]|jgi:hypothetical protein|nr:hypothetical protein [Fibromonadaceae bacterium]